MGEIELAPGAPVLVGAGSVIAVWLLAAAAVGFFLGWLCRDVIATRARRGGEIDLTGRSPRR